MALTAPPTSLRWAVKDSFIRYVTVSGGRVSCGNGARWADGEFDFAPDSETDDERTRTFLGDVLFVAHGTLLRVALGLPRIEVDGADAVLTAVTDPADPSTRAAIARATAEADSADADGRTRWTTTLTPEGALIFGGNYAPGTELAPIRF
jgi:hypothetical protein